jgi:hypothetical protein
VFGGFLVLISVVGAVMSRHPRDTGMVETFKQLTRDLAESFKEYSGEVVGGVIEDD